LKGNLMAALVFAPPPWQFFAFPLVVQWQAHYDALAFYFPDLHFGLLEDKPDQEVFTKMLQPPQPKGLQALEREYHPGELSQWQAYLNFLATQEHQDETDLKAAIRGHLEPILPKQVDPELVWSLAYQLEQMLSEQTAGLRRLAGQQQALAEVLGEDMGEAEELAPLEASFNPSLTGGLPDVTLARVRYRFWRQVLDPYLAHPWAALVLEAAAGESSPRYLWEAVGEEGGKLWQASFTLPNWHPQPGVIADVRQILQLGVEFRKTLGELLRALSANSGEIETSLQKMRRLVADRLWPASGLPQAQSVRLELFGWLGSAPEPELVSEPMLFLSPAG
jgi:hypothetical protein